jgi:hypothetical protein
MRACVYSGWKKYRSGHDLNAYHSGDSDLGSHLQTRSDSQSTFVSRPAFVKGTEGPEADSQRGGKGRGPKPGRIDGRKQTRKQGRATTPSRGVGGLCNLGHEPRGRRTRHALRVPTLRSCAPRSGATAADGPRARLGRSPPGHQKPKALPYLHGNHSSVLIAPLNESWNLEFW